MTYNEVIQNVYKRTGLRKSEVLTVIDVFLDEIANGLIRDGIVSFKHFATFKVEKRKERKGRNPQTGEVEVHPAVNIVKCRISRTMKNKIKDLTYDK